MKKILAAVDFSEASFNAVSYAAYLANTFNSKLLVVHAYAGTEAIDNEPLMDIFDSGRELEIANLNYLNAQMNGLIRKYTVKIDGIVQKGKPVQVIKNVAQTENASLIVMGMKGRGKSSFVFGSTTIDMIGKTEIPMIVVPEDITYKPLENIVVAIDIRDRKPVSRFKILNKIIDKYNPFLQILNVQKKDSELSAQVVADKMRAGLVWNKYNHNFNIIEADDVEAGIHNFLKRHPADLLAMVAQKHNLLERVFSKSYTKSMTRQSKVPLMILHPPKESK